MCIDQLKRVVRIVYNMFIPTCLYSSAYTYRVCMCTYTNLFSYLLSHVLRMCIHIYIYRYMCVYIYICIYMYLSVRIDIHACEGMAGMRLLLAFRRVRSSQRIHGFG